MRLSTAVVSLLAGTIWLSIALSTASVLPLLSGLCFLALGIINIVLWAAEREDREPEDE